MPRSLEKSSPCKVNLLLNILGRRPDGFHELETVMHPVGICDRLDFSRSAGGVELTCSDPALPADGKNLAHRAATVFLQAAGIQEGVRIHLEKKIPLAAGLGGGSGNAAVTLLGLNELFDHPLRLEQLAGLAGTLGSDVPFFLQNQPALATGRGEKLAPCPPFPALQGAVFLLVHPGFGISTAWAYQNLARFPEALNGKPGRAQRLVRLLETAGLAAAGAGFYNSLEAPALEKYPLLAIFQEFLRNQGAAAALMSGSGSTTFALAGTKAEAEELEKKVKAKFGATCWTAVVPV
jgi:4-diphosphocytidyl-2-C-methyl-D-erythritol kinase